MRIGFVAWIFIIVCSHSAFSACPRTKAQMYEDIDVQCAGIAVWRLEMLKNPPLNHPLFARSEAFGLKVAKKCHGAFRSEKEFDDWYRDLNFAISVFAETYKSRLRRREITVEGLTRYEAKMCKL